MNLSIYNDSNIEIKNLDNIYEKLFLKTLNILNLKDNYIMSVTFIDEEKIHEMNKTYRNIDRSTDVISFAFLDDQNELKIKGDFPIDLGEIYICYEVADRNRKEYNNSIERELAFLFVHGLLHLLGYDHMTEDDEKEMFSLQDEILEGVNIYE